jgi:pimeloyl-ACP methyl ester carboxylesterase
MDPAWLDGWQPLEFDLGDGSTEVVVLGSGPPLVLLPPLPGWKETWAPCAARLARGFRVVTCDLRVRFGRGDRWAALVADLARVMDGFAPGRVTLVGHSLGGALAQRLALAHPERVAGVVLSSAFARVVTPPGARRARFVEQPLAIASQRLLPEAHAARLARRLAVRRAWVYDPGCDEHVLGFVRFGIRHARVLEAARMVRLAFAHDTREALPRLAAPALILVGECDTAFARAAAAELCALLPAAGSGVSPGAGHLHPLSNAAWLAETIAAWHARAVGG